MTIDQLKARFMTVFHHKLQASTEALQNMKTIKASSTLSNYYILKKNVLMW